MTQRNPFSPAPQSLQACLRRLAIALLFAAGAAQAQTDANAQAAQPEAAQPEATSQSQAVEATATAATPADGADGGGSRTDSALAIAGSEETYGGVPLAPACGTAEFEAFSRDYRDRSPEGVRWLNVVEEYHFYAAVRRLSLEPAFRLVGELNYVLRRVPNHHRALFLLSQLELRKGVLPQRAGASTDIRFAYCFLDRARQFSRDDPTIEMLVGIHFHKRDAFERALSAYNRAVEMEPAFAEAHYNLGLLHYDRKDYKAAADSARRAAELGYPLTALRKNLTRDGHWDS